MMRIAAVIFVLICAAGCATVSNKTLVLDYQDFGPQVAAYKLIGMEWWQWESHGSPDPTYRYDIKVVVYRNIPLGQVKEEYPVIKENAQDYRYLSYSDAMEYLNEEIQADIVDEVTETLRKTKSRIEMKLGKPNEVNAADKKSREAD